MVLGEHGGSSHERPTRALMMREFDSFVMHHLVSQTGWTHPDVRTQRPPNCKLCFTLCHV